jgi:hypothetical protein
MTIVPAVIEAILAQSVERVTCNLEVLGSIPGDGSGLLLGSFVPLGRFPSGQRGQTVNLLAYAFEGSNPSLPIAPSLRGGAFCRMRGVPRWANRSMPPG